MTHSLCTLLAGLSGAALAGPPATWQPSEADLAVHHALSLREPAPSCDQVEALSDTPVQTLLVMVERVEAPPWVPLRAASCLATRHSDAVGAELTRWVQDPELRGLALVIFGQLDSLPAPAAVQLAETALGGPWADDARRHLAKAERPALQALVEGSTGGAP